MNKIILTADGRRGEVSVSTHDHERVNLDICNNHMADAWMTSSEARILAGMLAAAADELDSLPTPQADQ